MNFYIDGRHFTRDIDDIIQNDPSSIFIFFKSNHFRNIEFIEFNETDLFLFPDDIPTLNDNLYIHQKIQKPHRTPSYISKYFSLVVNWLKCKIPHGS